MAHLPVAVLGRSLESQLGFGRFERRQGHSRSSSERGLVPHGRQYGPEPVGVAERTQRSHRRFPAKGLRMRSGNGRKRPHNLTGTHFQHLAGRRAPLLDGQAALSPPADIGGAQLTQGLTGSLYH